MSQTEEQQLMDAVVILASGPPAESLARLVSSRCRSPVPERCLSRCTQPQ